MNVLYLLVSLGKSLTFWQTMDEVIKIFVIVAAIAFAAYQNYAKKEKKRNKPSRKKMVKPATVYVEPDIIMAGQRNECIEQSIDNKLNKKRKGEGRKHRKLSEEAPQKDVLSTAQQHVRPHIHVPNFHSAFLPVIKSQLSRFHRVFRIVSLNANLPLDQNSLNICYIVRIYVKRSSIHTDF